MQGDKRLPSNISLAGTEQMIPHRGLVRLGALPLTPTEALPGTEEKIQVMMQRAAQRQQLFHPHDGPSARQQKPVPVANGDRLIPDRERQIVSVAPLPNDALELDPLIPFVETTESDAADLAAELVEV